MNELQLGNIFNRPNVLPNVGDKVHGHYHNFDHVTLVSRGRVQIDAQIPTGKTMAAALAWGRAREHWHTLDAAVTNAKDGRLDGEGHAVAYPLEVVTFLDAELAVLQAEEVALKAAFDALLASPEATYRDMTVSLEAGEMVTVYAFVKHELTALAPNSVFNCIYSHHTPQGRIVQKWTGWDPAYA